MDDLSDLKIDKRIQIKCIFDKRGRSADERRDRWPEDRKGTCGPNILHMLLSLSVAKIINRFTNNP